MEDYKMANLLDDVAGLIDAAGKKEVVLIAHDWGAVIAWQFAIQKIRPLTQLVICNVPHPEPMRALIKSSWAQMKKSWYVFFFKIPHLPEKLLGRNGAAAIAQIFQNTAVDKSNFSPDVAEVYRQNADQPGALTAMVNYYRALLKFPSDRAQDKGIIDVPTLMLWGEEDVALEKASTYGTEEYVSNFRIRYLPGVSHWVQQEAPEVCNVMIEAFLTGTPIPEAHLKLELVAPKDND